jgi:hypothetical protein
MLRLRNPPVLSILICSLRERKPRLDALLAFLKPQCIARPIEVLTDVDGGEATIGAKRQRLLQRARGLYVCFIDDDDQISPTYVPDILVALEATPEATHCSLRGIMKQQGAQNVEFEHSIRYTTWEKLDGKLVRTPNHLNVIRRDLALQAGFVSSSWGEDRRFSDKLADIGCLIREAYIPAVLYYYCLPPLPPPPAAPPIVKEVKADQAAVTRPTGRKVKTPPRVQVGHKVRVIPHRLIHPRNPRLPPHA